MASGMLHAQLNTNPASSTTTTTPCSKRPARASTRRIAATLLAVAAAIGRVIAAAIDRGQSPRLGIDLTVGGSTLCTLRGGRSTREDGSWTSG